MNKKRVLTVDISQVNHLEQWFGPGEKERARNAERCTVRVAATSPAGLTNSLIYYSIIGFIFGFVIYSSIYRATSLAGIYIFMSKIFINSSISPGLF